MVVSDQSGSYKTYLVHEDLVVTERIDDLSPLGYYIYKLCEGKDTYRMQRRSEIMGKHVYCYYVIQDWYSIVFYFCYLLMQNIVLVHLK